MECAAKRVLFSEFGIEASAGWRWRDGWRPKQQFPSPSFVVVAGVLGGCGGFVSLSLLKSEEVKINQNSLSFPATESEKPDSSASNHDSVRRR